jgi:hypothetical protein
MFKKLGQPGYLAPDVSKLLKAAGQHDLVAVMEKALRTTRALSRKDAEAIDNWLIANGERVKAKREESTQRIRERWRKINNEQGLARLEQYGREQGLAQIPENAALVQQWIEANGSGWGIAQVDAAIKALRGKLMWVVQSEPIPTAPPWTPADPLPRNATTEMLRQSTPAQIREWLKAKSQR